MNAFLRSVRDLPVPAHSAVMWWLGQMGLLVKMGDTVACVDYYAAPSPQRQVPPPIPAEEMTGIDAFIASHDHSDHLDRVSWRIWAEICPEARFVFPAAHMRSVTAEGIPEERCLGMDDGTCCRIGDITVRAVAAAHEFLSRDPVTGTAPCLQYVLEGDGVRIHHAGDTLRYEGMLPKLLSLGPFDAALLPINGRDAARYMRGCIGNMTFQEAVDLAGEMRPRLVLPGHWDMFADNSADPRAFTEYLDAKYGGAVPARIPKYLEPIRVSGEG